MKGQIIIFESLIDTLLASRGKETCLLGMVCGRLNVRALGKVFQEGICVA